ncbi:MAG: MFS transporter [Candidatus Nanopelagicales bacterium]
MSDAAGLDPTALDTAIDPLGEPTKNVSWVFVLSLTLANIGIMMVLITPLNNLLPRYADAITGGVGKETALAWISGVGAVAAMVFNPLSGAFSDRTTSRFGRRRPWIVGGSLAAAALMILMSYQQSIVALAVAWFLVLAAANLAFSAMTAYIPDQVPVHQRGLVSGFVGLAQVVGVVLGVALVSVVVTDLQKGTWFVGAMMVIMLLPLVLAVSDAKLPRSALREFRWGAFWSGFWVSPKKYPDFAWAWITRFLVWLGTALATIYLLFYLQDFLHYAEPAKGQTVLIGLYGLGTVATAVIGGKLSDRSGKRKIFVIVSSIVMGLSVLILAFVPSFTGACIGAFLLGTGYGVYLAVDQALVTQVLPLAEDRARDLGVINIANTAPQILAPMLAAPLVTLLGYEALFGTTAVVMVLAGILVRFIRSVP